MIVCMLCTNWIVLQPDWPAIAKDAGISVGAVQKRFSRLKIKIQQYVSATASGESSNKGANSSASSNKDVNSSESPNKDTNSSETKTDIDSSESSNKDVDSSESPKKDADGSE